MKHRLTPQGVYTSSPCCVLSPEPLMDLIPDAVFNQSVGSASITFVLFASPWFLCLSCLFLRSLSVLLFPFVFAFLLFFFFSLLIFSVPFFQLTRLTSVCVRIGTSYAQPIRGGLSWWQSVLYTRAPLRGWLTLRATLAQGTEECN